MGAKILTQERLKELVHYDSDTGAFTWRISRPKALAGAVAGSVHRSGYIQIGVLGKSYGAHVLAWLYVYGTLPALRIDHRNEIKADNRIANLRIATRHENSQNISAANRNNKLGVRGVFWCKHYRRFKAHIEFNGKAKGLGSFVNLADAEREIFYFQVWSISE